MDFIALKRLPERKAAQPGSATWAFLWPTQQASLKSTSSLSSLFTHFLSHWSAKTSTAFIDAGIYRSINLSAHGCMNGTKKSPVKVESKTRIDTAARTRPSELTSAWTKHRDPVSLWYFCCCRLIWHEGVQVETNTHTKNRGNLEGTRVLIFHHSSREVGQYTLYKLCILSSTPPMTIKKKKI